MRHLLCIPHNISVLGQIQIFRSCNWQQTLWLFGSYCLCFYDIALWCNFSCSVRKKFSMCYYNCMKAFFGYRKYDSVTNMLLVLGLPSCDTIWHNAKVVFNSCICAVDNRIVRVFLEISFFFLSFLFNIFYYYSIISLYFLLLWYGSMWSDANKLIDWLMNSSYLAPSGR